MKKIYDQKLSMKLSRQQRAKPVRNAFEPGQTIG